MTLDRNFIARSGRHLEWLITLELTLQAYIRVIEISDMTRVFAVTMLEMEFG